MDIARPRIVLCIVVASVMCLLVVIAIAVPLYAQIPNSFSLPKLVQVSDAALNMIVLIGGAVFFLATVERRLQRQRVLAAIHELRALAHIIDMHQLSKDPQRVLQPQFVVTPSSPMTNFDAFALSRYLDDCGEMFSLPGKLAALYAMQLDDPAIIAAGRAPTGVDSGVRFRRRRGRPGDRDRHLRARPGSVLRSDPS